jgi:hypothetical protein
VVEEELNRHLARHVQELDDNNNEDDNSNIRHGWYTEHGHQTPEPPKGYADVLNYRIVFIVIEPK